MKFTALQQFLRDPAHAASQSFELLQKFLLYCKLVQDPLNVFRYMEEKSICTYFPLFWFARSQYLAQVGDYRNSFLCLKKADEMKQVSGDDERVKLLNTKLKAQTYKDQIQQEMLKYPPNKRRTVSDFNIMMNRFDDMPGTQQQKNQQMLKLIDTKFEILRSEKEKRFHQKNEGKPKSWLYEIYEKQGIKVMELIHLTEKNKCANQNEFSKQPTFKKAGSQNDQRLFRSLNTPFKRKDPMRIAKTLDSVQMLKRKRKSEQLQKIICADSENNVEENLNEDESECEQSSLICINTMPVGKRFENKKKHVKFQNNNQKSLFNPLEASEDSLIIEKLRNYNDLPKIDDVFDLSRKTAQKGILKNKSVERKQMMASPKFAEINQRSLKIKQTEEKEI